MSKLIPLTQGKFAIVDDADFDWLNQWNWHAHKCGAKWYAARKQQNPSTLKQDKVSMHREILGLPRKFDGRQGDHRNGDGLNNTRQNLRESTLSQNQQNRGKQHNNISGYKGVVFLVERGKYRAQIGVNGHYHYLGLYPTPEIASEVYKEAARKLHGEFAHA